MASRSGWHKPADAVSRVDSRTQVAAVRCDWTRQAGTATLIQVHARPGAGTSALLGEHGGRLKVAVGAPAVDGKANEALLAFIARTLQLPRSRLRLHSGATSREKTVLIEGADAEGIARELMARVSRSRK